MIRPLALPALLALLLTLTACRQDPQAALLEGTWLCVSKPPDYAMDRRVTFTPDGGLSGRTELQSTDEKTPVALHLTFSGSWELSDGQLTEKLATHRLMRFARNGQNVPLAELPAGFVGEVEGALAGQAAGYRIESLTKDALVLVDTAEGVQTTCERAAAP